MYAVVLLLQYWARDFLYYKIFGILTVDVCRVLWKLSHVTSVRVRLDTGRKSIGVSLSQLNCATNDGEQSAADRRDLERIKLYIFI